MRRRRSDVESLVTTQLFSLLSVGLTNYCCGYAAVPSSCCSLMLLLWLLDVSILPARWLDAAATDVPRTRIGNGRLIGGKSSPRL